MNIIETNLSFGSLSYGNKPNAIVLHHAEWSKCSVEDIHRLHKNSFGWSGIGYHFFVRKDGSIYRGRPENAIGAHAKNHNTNTLGICAEGSYMRETMTEAQKRAIINLGQYLKNKYGISKVYGHKELMSTDCPGTNYPLGEIRNAILSGTSTSTPSKPSSPREPELWEININGPIVRDLQHELNIQYNAGIKEDGWAGTITVDHLPIVRYGAKGNITRIAQKLLISKGYELPKYGADSIYGKEMKTAVLKFQSDNGLSADGDIGKNTWKALLRK